MAPPLQALMFVAKLLSRLAGYARRMPIRCRPSLAVENAIMRTTAQAGQGLD
jgi:hypothetical protein